MPEVKIPKALSFLPNQKAATSPINVVCFIAGLPAPWQLMKAIQGFISTQALSAGGGGNPVRSSEALLFADCQERTGDSSREPEGAADTNVARPEVEQSQGCEALSLLCTAHGGRNGRCQAQG